MAERGAVDGTAAHPLAPRPSRWQWNAERRFHLALTLAMSAVVFVGFARSFFLSPWFPDWPRPREPIFLVHGGLFTLWLVLLVSQALLVASRRVNVHRRVGWVGAALAAAMVPIGVYGGLVTTRRGFVGQPGPVLPFLADPLLDMALFASFVALGVLVRHNPQAHKRWMLLASITLLTAAFARWPFGIGQSPLLTYGAPDLFVVAMAAWDLASRRRLHPVTLGGGLALVLSQPVRVTLSTTETWAAFARWAIALLP